MFRLFRQAVFHRAGVMKKPRFQDLGFQEPLLGDASRQKRSLRADSSGSLYWRFAMALPGRAHYAGPRQGAKKSPAALRGRPRRMMGESLKNRGDCGTRSNHSAKTPLGP